MSKKKGAIGVFDSGVGGLTAVKALEKHLPNERFFYLADSLNLPYGNKSENDLERLCIENINFLIQNPLKALILACNTASAHVYESLKKRFNVPIFDVITPSVDRALKCTETKKIAVLATESTINSNLYEKLILTRMPEAEVTSIACPLLVSVIEENLLEHKLSQMLIKQYLLPLEETDVDVVILGCTHYPLLEEKIRQELPEHVEIIDSSECSVLNLKKYLEENSLLEKSKSNDNNLFFVSGSTDLFNKVGSSLLNKNVKSVKRSS
ncbi:MAG: Glutamate racemase 1 [Chlamydiae bacterium]|nr:Glutamate racemase 1 [Chlamydiota bacterium]